MKVEARYTRTEEGRRWEAVCPVCKEECWILNVPGRWRPEGCLCEHFKERIGNIFVFERADQREGSLV